MGAARTGNGPGPSWDCLPPSDHDLARVRKLVSEVMCAPRGTRLASARSLGFGDPRSDERAELLAAMAKGLLPELVGLPIADAQPRVDAEPALETSGPT